MSTTRSTLAVAGAGLLLLFALNLWLAPDIELQQSSTSFGVYSNGYKAIYDLLHELDVPAVRVYAYPPPDAPAHPRWLILPFFLDRNYSDYTQAVTELTAWIRSGGTAVVFGDERSDWKRIGLDEKTAAVKHRATSQRGARDRLAEAPASGSALLLTGNDVEVRTDT